MAVMTEAMGLNEGQPPEGLQVHWDRLSRWL